MTKEDKEQGELERSDLEQQMFDVLNRITPMPTQLFNEFASKLKLARVPKNTVLLAAGDCNESSFIIIKGLVRFFYTTEDGQEFNKAFYDEGQIVGALSSIILKEPCRYSIETLEACEMFVIPDDLYLEYVNKDIAWERLFSYCCQMMLVRNERREAELLLKSPKDRYLQFVRNFPEFVERIPQYHIASYLGITPVALSRSRAEWNKSL